MTGFRRKDGYRCAMLVVTDNMIACIAKKPDVYALAVELTGLEVGVVNSV